MSKRIIALKRISNDMKELEKCPLEGIGIASIDNDPMKFVVNIELMSGPYKGYKVQCLMTMSENYPINPPKILIYPNQEIGNGYHHHIFEDYSNGHFYKFCINLLENDFGMNTSEEYTGWNPAYTIPSILLQVQNFLSDPDKRNIPDKKKIQKLMKSMDSYQRPFFDGEKQVIHCWKNPFPKMYYSKSNNKMELDEEEEIKNEIKEAKEAKEEKDKANNRKKEMIKENLTCYFLRENFIDNPEILLGYPIVQSKALFGKDKIELYPIPQLLTYEAFQMQTGNPQVNNNNNLSSSNSLPSNSLNYNNNNNLFGLLQTYQPTIKAANNEYFNNWLPIYVNEEHYFKNLDTIKNSIKKIKNETEFKPEQIFDILPIILNKMIIGIFNGKSIISTSYMTCYFHYVLLFKRLCKEYKEEYDTYVNKKIKLITMNEYQVDKRIVSDIGDFFMLIFLSNKDMSSPEMKKIKEVLIEEFLIREMYWIFHGPDCSFIMRNKVNLITNKVKVKLGDDVYLDKFHKDPNFKMRFLDIFNKELHNKNIYHKVINTISNDKNFLRNHRQDFNFAKRQAEIRITQSFKRLYNECSDWGRNKLNEIIKENMNFSEFFDEDESDLRAGLYDSYQVNEILKGGDMNTPEMKEILKYAYESQKGNPLLLITFLVLNKLEEKGFLEELEKNYGIYLDIDKFYLNMNNKLKEVKSFKELYDFIGTDFGKDKTELELIVEAYEKAKQKKYIRDPNESNRTNFISNNYEYQNNFEYQDNYGYNDNYGYHNNYRYPNNKFNRYRGKRW